MQVRGRHVLIGLAALVGLGIVSALVGPTFPLLAERVSAALDRPHEATDRQAFRVAAKGLKAVVIDAQSASLDVARTDGPDVLVEVVRFGRGGTPEWARRRLGYTSVKRPAMPGELRLELHGGMPRLSPRRWLGVAPTGAKATVRVPHGVPVSIVARRWYDEAWPTPSPATWLVLDRSSAWADGLTGDFRLVADGDLGTVDATPKAMRD